MSSCVTSVVLDFQENINHGRRFLAVNTAILHIRAGANCKSILPTNKIAEDEWRF